jgi:hypothetical protein
MTSPHRLPILVLLDHEWQVLATDGVARRRAAGWGVVDPSRHHLDDSSILTAVLHAAGHRDDRGRVAPDGDDVLRRLVVLARADDLAARVVVQRVLPGVASFARRWAWTSDASSAADELIGALWEVVRDFPVERRASPAAAGLLREAEYRAFRRARRQKVQLVSRDPGDRFWSTHRFAVATHETDPASELDELLVDAARRGLDPDHVALVRRIATGADQASLAREFGVTDRTIRNRRDAAVRELRALAVAA